MARYAPSSDSLEERKFEFEKDKQQWEILKFLHAAGLARWKDRRDNEWKLNYAIWAAIAGLDGLLLLHRGEVQMERSVIIAGGVVAMVLHSTYLWPTIERAIKEIYLQRDAERAIHELISDETIKNKIQIKNLGGDVDRYDNEFGAGVWRRYGLVAPLGLTAALLILAGFLLDKEVQSKNHKTAEPLSVVVKFANP